MTLKAEDIVYSDTLEAEFNIHDSPAHLLPLFKKVFPDLQENEENLKVIPTWQKTTANMSGWSDVVSDYRDNLGEKFIKFATEFSKQLKLINSQVWVDLIDPFSAKPHLGNAGSTIYMETDDANVSLGYEVAELGCCKVVCHRDWAMKAFLATIFTNATKEEIKQAINKTTI